jgi:hypothetical protein
LYYYTIRYLKWIQICYQIWYRVRSKWRNCFKYRHKLSSPSHSVSLNFIDWIDKPETLSGDSFSFLNLSNKFENLEINWNFDGYGKLWNYNLNYMDFLLQPGLGKERGIRLIHDYVLKLTNKSTGLESYPISIRGINLIKFLTKHGIHDSQIDNSLFAQYKILLCNPEYHLLGNHLLENGFSLLFGAFYYSNLRLYDKAKDIIENELNEQILDDGGHFELSPMYHQIILDRVLDCINLLQNNKQFDEQESLHVFIRDKSEKMLQWLNRMTFSNGNIPLLNDSATGIAPSTQQLNNYAIRLGITSEKIIPQIQLNSSDSFLKESGYRRFNGSNYECIIDVGQPGPDYQPGHAHADTFSFELYFHGKPIIVDAGVSTYDKNERRQLERSTSSHNTVQIGNFNSSEVWGGFRVARRANVVFLEENDTIFKARHNGYRQLGIIHEREFNFEANSFCISDRLIGEKQIVAVSRFHFHPGTDLRIEGNRIIFHRGELNFENVEKISILNYMFAPGFNVLIPGKVVEISFKKQLKSTFRFE